MLYDIQKKKEKKNFCECTSYVNAENHGGSKNKNCVGLIKAKKNISVIQPLRTTMLKFTQHEPVNL